MAVPWRYLDFEVSEDADGNVTFDALASVAAAQWPALMAEVESLLQWAEHGFGGHRAPLDDGGDWDCELQGSQEAVTPLAFSGPGLSGRLDAEPRGDSTLRYTLSVTVSGNAAFADAWHARWG